MAAPAHLILATASTPAGRAELVEMHWPALVAFAAREERLVLELALPPHALSASVCLPEIDAERRFIASALFARLPGVLVEGRAEGGTVQAVRLTVDAPRAAAIMPEGTPSPDLLRALMAIQCDMLRQVMEMLARELARPDGGDAGVLASLADLAVLSLGRVIADEARGTSSPGLAPWQFRRIRERIEAPGAAPLAAELADLCGISVRHLHRQFHALTGRSVADYVAAARIDRAKRLLATPDRAVGAVARDCGFSHAQSFARAFRRSTGMTPLAFRQQRRHTKSQDHKRMHP